MCSGEVSYVPFAEHSTNTTKNGIQWGKLLFCSVPLALPKNLRHTPGANPRPEGKPGFVWKCWVYSQWNSHLTGIMISKTIGWGYTIFRHTRNRLLVESHVWVRTPSGCGSACVVAILWAVVVFMPLVISAAQTALNPIKSPALTRYNMIQP